MDRQEVITILIKLVAVEEAEQDLTIAPLERRPMISGNNIEETFAECLEVQK